MYEEKYKNLIENGYDLNSGKELKIVCGLLGIKNIPESHSYLGYGNKFKTTNSDLIGALEATYFTNNESWKEHRKEVMKIFVEEYEKKRGIDYVR